MDWSRAIAKNRNTYAKRQREYEKQQRATDKRQKRESKKNEPGDNSPPPMPDFYALPDISVPLP